MPKKKINIILMVFFIMVASVALLLAIYFLPPVHDRLSWRVANFRSDIYYFFNPPGEVAFSPRQQAEMEEIINLTKTPTLPEPTVTLEPTNIPTDYISPTPTFTATATPTPTPIPDVVRLEGVVHEYQKFNNCGPATLSMALSFWGWEGDQTVTAAKLKPNQDDRNVMPYEMVGYVRTETNLNAISRMGGDLEMIKKFVAAGFPMIIERGFEEEVEQRAWMGHYNLITAYDDNTEMFIAQDSYVKANYAQPYERIERHWRAFNYIYIVVYPPEREAEVLSILGPHVDETYNLQHAAQKALQEIAVLSGRELFFAWFNYGTSLMNLGDYYGSAQAFDQAFEVYAELPVRPWRVMWYQTGPYFAYFYTGRYQDVIDLANDTLRNSFVPAIEETWVWRGRAKLALGDVDGAVEDFREALEWHPGWWVAETELRNLGITP